MENPDEKLLKMVEILKELKIIRFEADFYKKLGIIKQQYHNIKTRKISFTARQIAIAIDVFDINPNWIFGVSQDKFLKKVSQTQSVVTSAFADVN
jgi:hypothetical protein